MTSIAHVKQNRCGGNLLYPYSWYDIPEDKAHRDYFLGNETNLLKLIAPMWSSRKHVAVPYIMWR